MARAGQAPKGKQLGRELSPKGAPETGCFGPGFKFALRTGSSARVAQTVCE